MRTKGMSMYENIDKYIAKPESLVYVDDSKVVHFLRQAIINVFSSRPAVHGEHIDPYGIRTVLREVFRRCAEDGVNAHKEFTPITVAMAGIAQENLHQDQELANRLGSVVYENPWKKLTGDKSDIPDFQYYDIM